MGPLNGVKILELAGIEARHQHFARSLVPQLRGAAGDPQRAVFAEAGTSTLEPRARESDASHGLEAARLVG